MKKAEQDAAIETALRYPGFCLGQLVFINIKGRPGRYLISVDTWQKSIVSNRGFVYRPCVHIADSYQNKIDVSGDVTRFFINAEDMPKIARDIRSRIRSHAARGWRPVCPANSDLPKTIDEFAVWPQRDTYQQSIEKPDDGFYISALRMITIRTWATPGPR